MSVSIRGRPVRFSLSWLRPPPVPVDGSMTLFEHLRELRYRLVVSSLAIVVATVLCAIFQRQLFDLLRRPFVLGVADLQARHPELNPALVNDTLTSPFILVLKICLVGGLVLSGPIWLWQLWAFIMPGLLAREKKWALVFVGVASPLFAAGVLTAYLVMPKGISVLLGFTQEGVSNLLNINSFLSFLLRLMVVFGIAYLIPLLVLMLNIVGVVKAATLAKYRVYVIFFTFVFGAVATPTTDPFSMIALALPMSLLFVVAEVIAHILDRTRARQAAAGAPLEIHDRALEALEADDARRADEDRTGTNGATAWDPGTQPDLEDPPETTTR